METAQPNFTSLYWVDWIQTGIEWLRWRWRHYQWPMGRRLRYIRCTKSDIPYSWTLSKLGSKTKCIDDSLVGYCSSHYHCLLLFDNWVFIRTSTSIRLNLFSYHWNWESQHRYYPKQMSVVNQHSYRSFRWWNCWCYAIIHLEHLYHELRST